MTETGTKPRTHEGTTSCQGPECADQTSCRRASVPSCLPRPAFTLTEMLIVIGIIVMVVMLAIPAFKTMTGSTSIEAAANQVSSYLGRARAEAIGLQQATGVLFFLDPATQRVNLIMVNEVQVAGAPTTVAFLDAVPNRDSATLPPGVLIQTIDNAAVNASGARLDDGFIGFNPIVAGSQVTNPQIPAISCGGVILFDGNGRLISKEFRFFLKDANQQTSLSKLLWGDDSPPRSAVVGTFKTPMQSAFGFVLFDRERFMNPNTPYATAFTLDDFATAYTNGSPSELDEERWLDENAVPYFINRINGTLVKGE